MAQEKKGYHEGEPWKGFPRFECDSCPFDSLHENVVADHVRHRHGPSRAERLAMLQTYDRSGKPMDVTVPVEAPPSE